MKNNKMLLLIKNMKKICYFINSDWYFDLHWIERALAAKCAGFEIHVLCRFLDPKIKKNLENKGIICHDSAISSLSVNPFHFIYSSCHVWRLLKRINPDILHCITIKPCLIGGFFARFHKRTLILSFVGLGRFFMKNSKIKCFIRKLLAFSYKCISDNEKCILTFEHEKDREDLVQITKIDGKKTLVIHSSGVNIDLYSYSQEVERQMPIVLFASRMLWNKGLGDLIAAKKKLADRGVYFELDVAGISIDGDPDAIPSSQIEDWHKQGIINWLGKRDDINLLIQSSNVIALPTTYLEGVPRILLEAGASGRATIAYDVNGCRSLIIDGETGYLVEQKNIDLFADKLESLLKDNVKRIDMGLHARKRVEDSFASSIVINDTLNLYQRAMEMTPAV